jgi:hypothetical protein
MSLIYPIYTKEELEAMNTPRIANIVGYPFQHKGDCGYISANASWLKVWNTLRKSNAPRPATYKEFLIAEYFRIQNTDIDTIKLA